MILVVISSNSPSVVFKRFPACTMCGERLGVLKEQHTIHLEKNVVSLLFLILYVKMPLCNPCSSNSSKSFSANVFGFDICLRVVFRIIKSHISNILLVVFVSLRPRSFSLLVSGLPPKNTLPPSAAILSPRSFFPSWSAVDHPKTCPHHQPPSWMTFDLYSHWSIPLTGIT